MVCPVCKGEKFKSEGNGICGPGYYVEYMWCENCGVMINQRASMHNSPEVESTEKSNNNQMEVKEKGFYRFTKDWYNRGSMSVTTERKGSVIEITQVDKINRKVISKAFLNGWVSWDLPVVKCNPPKKEEL